MPGTWNEFTERRLFLCIIEHSTPANWKKVAEMMGEGFSHEACRWTPESERAMLLLAITSADLKPTQQTWSMVAERLGGGLNASAVSQKFHKLKRESEKTLGDDSAPQPTTPAGRGKTIRSNGNKSTTKRKNLNGDDRDAAAADDDESPTTKKIKKVKTEECVKVKVRDDEDSAFEEKSGGPIEV